MRQMELFRDSVHLDWCEADPNPYDTEPIYYTNWPILYGAELALEKTVVVLYPPPPTVVMEMFPAKAVA